MNKKRLIVEVLIIIAMMIYGIVYGGLSLKKEFGSSDNPLTVVGKIDNLFVIKADKITLGITTSDNKIKSVLFLNNDSNILYNKNIEGKKISTGIENILNVINNKSTIKDISVIYYKGNLNIKDLIIKFCNNKCTYKEAKSTIKELAETYEIDYTTDEEAIRDLNYYSKELIRKNKNKIITNDNSKEETDYVYTKLVDYVTKNNIINEEKGKNSIEIFLIPTSPSIDNYPTANSYYYVKDGKVYAYIEINNEDKISSYCYNGSIDNYNSGSCK